MNFGFRKNLGGGFFVSHRFGGGRRSGQSSPVMGGLFVLFVLLVLLILVWQAIVGG